MYINEDNKEDYLKRKEPIVEKYKDERDSYYSALIEKDIRQEGFYKVLNDLINEAEREGKIE